MPPIPTLADLASGKVLDDVSGWVDGPLRQRVQTFVDDALRSGPSEVSIETIRVGGRTLTVPREVSPLATALLLSGVGLVGASGDAREGIRLRFGTSHDAAQFVSMMVPADGESSALYQRAIAQEPGAPGAWTHKALLMVEDMGASDEGGSGGNLEYAIEIGFPGSDLAVVANKAIRHIADRRPNGRAT